MSRPTPRWSAIAAGAAAYAVADQLWVYATFASSLSREDRLRLSGAADVASLLVLAAVTAFVVVRGRDRRVGSLAWTNAAAAGIGSLLAAAITSLWAPQTLFKEGVTLLQLSSIAATALLVGALGGLGGSLAGLLLRAASAISTGASSRRPAGSPPPGNSR